MFLELVQVSLFACDDFSQCYQRQLSGLAAEPDLHEVDIRADADQQQGKVGFDQGQNLLGLSGLRSEKTDRKPYPLWY